MKTWFIGAALALLLTGPAFACSCLGPGSAAAQAGEADVVFLGRAKATQPRGRSTEVAVTTFKVSRTLKGGHAGVRGVEHHLAGPTCGVEFAPGREYLILASSRDGRLSTNLCRMPRFPIQDYEGALKRR